MEQLLAETLEARFDASTKGEPVALALRNHDLQGMRTLLDAEPELIAKGDRRSNQPIHWATMTRQLDAIDELLERGADIDARRMDRARPIHVTNGDYFYRGWRDVPRDWPVTPAQVMERLKARGAVVDLPTACHTGDIERVRKLLRQDPSLANKLGEHEGYYLGAGAPLSNAAAVGRLDIVQLLLDHGAFPNPPVESSGDALWIVQTWRPDKRMEQLLLSYGATPTEPSPPRRDEDWPTHEHNWLRITPLHEAARKGDLAEAKRLTPLAWAIKRGHGRIAKLLEASGDEKG